MKSRISKSDRINYMKALLVLVLVIIGCSLSGCVSNSVSEEIATEETAIVADEFEAVYVQTKAGVNHFVIYRHVPTDMMYVCYINNSMAPMGITYDEYIGKAKTFHKNNDTVITDTQSENGTMK